MEIRPVTGGSSEMASDGCMEQVKGAEMMTKIVAPRDRGGLLQTLVLPSRRRVLRMALMMTVDEAVWKRPLGRM